MAEPFNYNIASPMAAFQNSYALGQAISQQDAARAEAAKKATRAQEAKLALDSIIKDRSPQNIAAQLLKFPELKEQVAASEAILSDAEKTSANQLRSEVLSLFKAGKRDAARARLQTQADAYKNTPGKEKEAAAAEALLKSFDVDADAVILPMSIQLAQSDEKLYKTLFDNTDFTAFQKDLVAAGIDPKSPKGIALSESFVANKADPLVEIETPSGGKFVGPRSEYFKRYGGQAPAPTTIPSPATKAEYDALPIGAQYRAPDGSLKVKGGQTGTPAPSGNFR